VLGQRHVDLGHAGCIVREEPGLGFCIVVRSPEATTPSEPPQTKPRGPGATLSARGQALTMAAIA
jgi:hypothetical protein